MRGSVAVAGALAVTLAVLACGSGSHLGRYHDRALSFSYPATWQARHFSIFVLRTVNHYIVFLSTSPMHDPCVRARSDGRLSYTCQEPVRSLPSGGVLVSWLAQDLPGAKLSRMGGKRTLIAGRPAHIQVARPGGCRRIDAQETFTATIAGTAPEALLTMTACLCGPDIASTERQVRTMLRSTALVH
jgi:hypothetical protein